MPGKDKSAQSVPFASLDYFSEKILQLPITAVDKTITKPTALRNNEGITLVYFRSGHGKIVVNSTPLPVGRGCLLSLGSYHYYQLQPESESLQYSECNLSYETFLFMAASPYYDFPVITLQRIPLTCLLDETMISRTERVVDQLVKISLKPRQKSPETAFFLIMRLMGILQKTYIRELQISD